MNQQEKEVLEKIGEILGKEPKFEPELDDRMIQLIEEHRMIELWQYMLGPVLEAMKYESMCGKVFHNVDGNKTIYTVGSDREIYAGVRNARVPKFRNSVEISWKDITSGGVFRAQDKARQEFMYGEDSAAVKLFREVAFPRKFDSLKAAFKGILKTFDDRGLHCDYIFMNRALVSDLVNHCSTDVDPITKRDLIMAGHIGILNNEDFEGETVSLICTAGTQTFEVVEENELFGVCSPKCIRDPRYGYSCVGKKDSIFWEGDISLVLLDKDAVVFAQVEK